MSLLAQRIIIPAPMLVFMLLGLSSCCEPVCLDGDYPYEVVPRFPDTSRCFRLVKIEDQRDQKSLGVIACNRVTNDSILDWVKNGLVTIHVMPSDPNITQDECVQVEVYLQKAYGRSITTSMSCNVVLQTKYFYRGVFLGEEICRGTQTVPNFASMKGEIRDAFDNALKKALEKMMVNNEFYSKKATPNGS